MTTIATFGSILDVNTNENGAQVRPFVTALDNGGFAVVWVDSRGPGTPTDPQQGDAIKMQLYDATGNAVGGEIAVTGFTNDAFENLTLPHVAGFADGSMVVVWVDRFGSPQSNDQIMAQRFDDSGAPIGGAFEIATGQTGSFSATHLHDVVALDNGRFALHWEDGSSTSPEDKFQIINSDNTALLSAPRAYTSFNDYNDPASSNQMVALDGGGFALAWSNHYEMSPSDVQMRIYDAQGQIVLNRGFLFSIDFGDVTSIGIEIDTLSNGNLVVTWAETSGFSNPNASTKIAIYAPDGSVVLADTVISNNSSRADIVALDGTFVVQLLGENTATEYYNDGTVADTGLVVPTGFFDAATSFGGLLAQVILGTDNDGSGIDLQFFTVNESAIVGTNDDETLNGTADDDLISGLGGDDILNGLAGDDVLNGGAGTDTLNGGDGNDTLYIGQGGATGAGDVANGDAGDDLIQISSLNPDSLHVIDGGTGSDTVDLRSYVGNAQFTIDLAAQSWIYTGTSQNVVASLSGIENFISGDLDDIITGDDQDNFLDGRGGADVIHGGGGNDWLRGGLGLDTFDGGDGTDTLDFSDFGISLSVRFDIGRVTFTNNLFETFANIETFLGGNGNDTLIGTDGSQTLDGGGGNDVLRGLDGADTLIGGAGNDIIFVDSSDNYSGGEGYDRIFSESQSAALNVDLGAHGFEFASGSNVADTLNASTVTEAVKLFGNGGDDILTGSGFNDYLGGGAGNDTLMGGAGNDTLDGLTGADSLSGGAGDDILFVDHLDTLLDGGTGYDRIYVRGYAQAQTYDLGAGNLEFANGNIADDIFDASTADWSVKLLGQGGDDTLIGGSADDQLYGSIGDDTLSGGAGNDILNASAGSDSLDGGAGDDIIFMDHDDTMIIGGTGYDRVYANSGSLGLTLDLTNAGVEYVSGSSTGDMFTAVGSTASVKLLGRNGNDSLIGGEADDLIYGEQGNDTLTGGGGNDFLAGGTGQDSFVFAAGWGDDIISDFDNGTEQIDMTALGISFADLTITVNAFGTAVVNYDGNSITLLGLQAVDVDAGDFLF